MFKLTYKIRSNDGIQRLRVQNHATSHRVNQHLVPLDIWEVFRHLKRNLIPHNDNLIPANDNPIPLELNRIPADGKRLGAHHSDTGTPQPPLGPRLIKKRVELARLSAEID